MGFPSMQLSPNFHDDTAGRNPQRVSFQFTASGSNGAGVFYVTKNVEGDAMPGAQAAAKVAAKRAGCDVSEVTLHRIMAPVL